MVPPHRRFLILSAALIALHTDGLSVALAQDMATQLGACRAIADNAARLACYDRLSDAVRSPPASVVAPLAPPPGPTPPATTPQPVAPAATPAPAPTPAQRFADDRLPAAKRDAPPEPDEIQASVTALRLIPGGFVEVTLETGQVWRQTDGEPIRLGLGAKVRIRKGLVGSFLLNEVGRNKSYRVKRVE